MPAEMLDIRLQVDRTWKNISMEIDRGGPVVVPYDGPYYVKPGFYFQQRLETFGKRMTDDVLVDSIKVTETSNPQGGKTIVIG